MIISTVSASNCTPQTIVIGRRGTYETMQIVFDLTYLIENYGNGTAVLAIKRSQDESAYPAVVTQEDNTLTWTITETDTYYVGSGECQLMWYVDGGLAKTIIYPMVVMRDILSTAEEPPDGYENWVEHLTELGAETQQHALDAARSASEAEQAKDDAVDAKEASEEAARKAEAASVHAPIIQNGYWYIWNDGQYVDTGVRAEGQKGDKGDTGEKGDTGNGIASITKTGTSGLVDTYTVTYTDGTTTTFTVTNGAKGDKGDTGATGNGIASIAKTGTSGNVDTYTITYTNGQTTTFTVTNGAVSSVAGKTGVVTLDANDVAFSESGAYDDGTVGKELSNQKNAIGELNRQLNDVDSSFNSVAEYVAPVNLYNKNSPLNIDNYRLQAGSASTSASGSSISHPIKIEAGKTYTFKYSVSYYGVTANRIVKYCDKDGNLVNEWRSISATDNGTASGTFTVSAEQIAENSDYVCVNVRMNDKGVMIFAEGDTLPAYSDWFEPYWMIRESALPDNMPLPANAQNNLLYGKKAAFTGDSICYGHGAAGGYAAIIGSDNSMTISNTGQTGATLATGTTVDGGNRGWISQKVGNMPDGYDYYIVEGGVNDAAGDVNVPLGTLSSGYTETLDTTTLYGAMEQICKTLQTTFLGKKYGFLIPHNCYGMSHRWNTQFRPAMKECLEKWGIPYLDLSDKCVQLNNLSALRTYTLNGDGWHPTEEGYRLFYVPKIEAWMKTL